MEIAPNPSEDLQKPVPSDDGDRNDVPVVPDAPNHRFLFLSNILSREAFFFYPNMICMYVGFDAFAFLDCYACFCVTFLDTLI